MAVIADIVAREVFDSRADITLEVDVLLDSGAIGRAIIPSGCSMGKYEAVEVRDHDLSRFQGKGVITAIEIVRRKIKPALLGLNPCDQDKIDAILIDIDNTPNKSHLGANSILAVSLATARSAAIDQGISLCEYLNRDQEQIARIPKPIFSMLSGGMHGDGNCNFQDYQIIVMDNTDLEQQLQIAKKVHLALKSILIAKGMCTGVSGTGGYLPILKSNEEGLSLLVEAITLAGYTPGKEVSLSMDIAAEMFFEDGLYKLSLEDKQLNTDEFIQYLVRLVDGYPISLMEDPLGEDDFDGWRTLTSLLGDRIELVGDDLFTTNIHRFKSGIKQGIANSILVKPNQIGTLTETLEIINFAQREGYGVVVSRRSGETEDTSIADLAVSRGCAKVKFGSLARTESMAKYNQLLRLKELVLKPAFISRKEIEMTA